MLSGLSTLPWGSSRTIEDFHIVLMSAWSKAMNPYMYEIKIHEMENDIKRVRQRITILERCLELNPEYDRNLLKAQLDLLTNLTRVLKEEIGFYLKLGESYDLAVFHVLFVETLKTICPDLATQLIEQLLSRCSAAETESRKADEDQSEGE
jgi:hypothetical protein